MRKPIEMEAQLLFASATHVDITLARLRVDEGMRTQFPAYRYSSERIYANGKLMHVARTYKYSPIRAAKVWLLEKLGRRKRADPIRHFGG